MSQNIWIATSWNELNEWQIQEIAHLYLNTPAKNFHEVYPQMIAIVYQKEDTPIHRFELFKLIRNVPASELGKYTTFLLEENNYYRFPSIPGLIKPSDRLGNISIRQFSTIDTFFHQWNQDRSLLKLKRLVASLYRINKKYDDLDLSAVDAITREIPVKKMEAIALAYLFTRISISDQYKVVFPEVKEESEEEKKLQPVFKKKEQQYIPFDKIIIGLSMDELQPLGKKQDINDVRIYEFLSVLSESILYHKEKAKAYEGK
ncbi:hypothetical protein ACNFU2_06420 [Chryseobacterium sp. PTM-20240506]|uniref:hypothetical protein n=1 Tax=Chryseobacterium sp. PTM-20240506 TaxID=3400631 RepID=UPI003AABCDF4